MVAAAASSAAVEHRLHRANRVASLSLQEFSTLCKQCRLLAPYLSVSKIDLLFITIDRKYGDDVENGNPARALVLHEFMEAAIEQSPKQANQLRGEFNGALDGIGHWRA